MSNRGRVFGFCRKNCRHQNCKNGPRETRKCSCGCGETFSVLVNRKKRYIHNHGHRLSEIHCLYCDKKFKPERRRIKCCTNSCGNAYAALSKRGDKSPILRVTSRKGMTKPERIMHAALIETGLPFESQYVIRGARTRPDFCFPAVKLAIYVDGEYWHEKPSTKVIDKKINDRLYNLGWQVLRFPAREVLRDVRAIAGYIKKRVSRQVSCKMIVAIGHRARNGKDTAAEAIKKAAGGDAKIFKFAAALYKTCQEQYGMADKSPKLLQRVGLAKRKENPYYWIQKTVDQLREFKGTAIISDLRFGNELETVKLLGGHTLKVQRLNDDGSQFYSEDRDCNHPSETSLEGSPFDFYIAAKSGQEQLVADQAVTLYNYIQKRSRQL